MLDDEFDAAIEDLNFALDIRKKLFEKHDRRISEILFHIGRAYKNVGDFAKAADYYLQTKDTLTELIGMYVALILLLNMCWNHARTIKNVLFLVLGVKKSINSGNSEDIEEMASLENIVLDLDEHIKGLQNL